VARVTLQVVDGPDRGQTRELTPGQALLVGRTADCDLRLNDAQCSRRHCSLELRPGGLWVEDLGSRGGTVVLGRNFQGGGALIPLAGARVELGGTELRFEVQASPALPLPEVPGYQVEERLGEGGSGEVYAALEEASGQRVALKFLQVEADATTLARADREARLASQLEHPGLAKVLRVIRGGERVVLVRELAEGESLEARISRAPLPWREAFSLGASLADALEAAHQGGVIHRDVKPGNVICTPTGPRLIDFDLALGFSLEKTLTRLTQPGQGLGTLCYLPPEQLDDAYHADVRSDVYGLGVTLYHALGGAPPFMDVPQDEFLSALTKRGPSPLSGLAPAIRDLVSKAYALDPALRYASATEFGAALRGALK
jgi:serine/threonine protein kinase